MHKPVGLLRWQDLDCSTIAGVLTESISNRRSSIREGVLLDALAEKWLENVILSSCSDWVNFESHSWASKLSVLSEGNLIDLSVVSLSVGSGFPSFARKSSVKLSGKLIFLSGTIDWSNWNGCSKSTVSGCWKTEMDVPWNEFTAVFDDGLLSILSIAAEVNVSFCKRFGRTPLCCSYSLQT